MLNLKLSGAITAFGIEKPYPVTSLITCACAMRIAFSINGTMVLLVIVSLGFQNKEITHPAKPFGRATSIPYSNPCYLLVMSVCV